MRSKILLKPRDSIVKFGWGTQVFGRYIAGSTSIRQPPAAITRQGAWFKTYIPPEYCLSCQGHGSGGKV